MSILLLIIPFICPSKIQVKLHVCTNFQNPGSNSLASACIKGNLGVRASQKLPWDFQKSMPGSLFSHL